MTTRNRAANVPVAYQLPAAVLLIVGGLIACFFGYRLFKFVLAIFGFILGALAASSVFGVSDTTPMVIAAIVGGTRSARCCCWRPTSSAWRSSARASARSSPIVIWTQIEGDPHPFVVVLFSVAGALLATWLQRYVIILGTAFGGAWTIIVGDAGADGRQDRAQRRGGRRRVGGVSDGAGARVSAGCRTRGSCSACSAPLVQMFVTGGQSGRVVKPNKKKNRPQNRFPSSETPTVARQKLMLVGAEPGDVSVPRLILRKWRTSNRTLVRLVSRPIAPPPTLMPSRLLFTGRRPAMSSMLTWISPTPPTTYGRSESRVTRARHRRNDVAHQRRDVAAGDEIARPSARRSAACTRSSPSMPKIWSLRIVVETPSVIFVLLRAVFEIDDALVLPANLSADERRDEPVGGRPPRRAANEERDGRGEGSRGQRNSRRKASANSDVVTSPCGKIERCAQAVAVGEQDQREASWRGSSRMSDENASGA